MKRKDIARYLVLRSIGNFLLLFALYGVGATFGPALFYEVQFRIDQYQGIHYVVADTTNTSTSPSLFVSGSSNTRTLVPVNTSFSIVIPKIGADAQVLANVNPANEDEYLKALKLGVAHAKGTSLPNQNGTIYMFAHSTDNFWDVGRYNAIFYLLKDLNIGDNAIIFYNNKRYDYSVTDKKITDPSDVSYLVNSKKTENQLVLQTCWPPGTTLKRLLVIAKPV